MTERFSKTLTRYNVRLCADGYHIVDESEYIVSDAFRTQGEAIEELELWQLEQAADEGLQLNPDPTQAYLDATRGS